MDISAMSPETQKVLGTCAVALGVIYCFFGYRFFKIALFSTGFMACSMAATYLSYLISPKGDTAAMILSIVGGLAGGFLFFFVYLIGVFALGASFGSLIGAALTALAGREIQPLLIVILGVVGGSLALLLQKHIVILATSFGGSGGIVSGAWYAAKGIDPVTIVQKPVSLGREFHAIAVCWLIGSILGVLVQYRITGKPRKAAAEERKKGKSGTEGEPEPPAKPMSEEQPAPQTQPKALADTDPRASSRTSPPFRL